MIAKDQPQKFSPHVIAAVTSVNDGNMKKGMLPPEQMQEVDNNRSHLFEALSIDQERVVLVSLSYKKEDFCVYREATSQQAGDGIVRPDAEIADALVTREKNIALFLPIADCCGAVLYDTRQELLMVSHLGRHSVEQEGGRRSVEHLTEQYGTRPSDLQVWLSPAAGKEHYPLFAFDHRSLHEVIAEQMVQAGVNRSAIEVSGIDVTKDENYYSHSEFLKGHRSEDGRFAVIAMMQ